MSFIKLKNDEKIKSTYGYKIFGCLFTFCFLQQTFGQTFRI